MFYHFLKSFCDLDNGLEPLASDQDVMLLAKYVAQGLKLVELYVEHKKINPDIYTPPKPKKLVIEELEDDEPIISRAGIILLAKKLVLDVNESQISGKDKGQSSGNGQEPNVVTLEARKSSEVGKDGSSQVPSQFVNVFHSSYDPYVGSRDPNFDPFVDLDSILPPVNNRQCNDSQIVEVESDDKYGDDTDSQESDYLVDEDNNVDELIEKKIGEDVEVLDNDYFESASDTDDEGSRGVIPSLPAYEDLGEHSGPSQLSGSKLKWTKEKVVRFNGYKSQSKDRLTKEKLFNGGKPKSKKQVDDNKCPCWIQIWDEGFARIIWGIYEGYISMTTFDSHIYCVKHIHDNMKLKWNGAAYEDFLWRAATSITFPDFQLGMEELKAFNKPAYKWLNLIPPQH
ncbi:hypothetical protein Tco_0308334 [Tanacetum coccineum]